jgi:site-specific DNA recombinase
MRQQKTNKTNPAALIYCRVSTEKQEQEGTSLDSQAAACIAYAKQNGYEVAEVVKETFSGAYLFDRPKLNEERAKIRAGEYGAIIVYAIDRLSRDIAHLSILVDEIERFGAKLHFVTENLDNTAEGKLMLSVRSYVAEVERIKIRERSMRGRMSKLQAGKIVNHCDLYGYTFDKKNAVRVINDDEAAVIRRIFSEYLANKSVRAIVTDLNKDNVPPPSMGKKNFKHEKFKTVKEYGANFWATSTISKILRNESYTGKAYANQYGSRMVAANGVRKIERYIKPRSEWIELPGTTPAIVSPEIFAAAQNRQANSSSFITRNTNRPVMLRGLVSCRCGRLCYPEFVKGRKPGQVYLNFRCASRGKVQCAYSKAFSTVSGTKLDAKVWGKISALLSNPETIRLELEQRLNSSDNERQNIEADINATKATLAKTEAEVKKLVDRIAVVDDSVFDLVQKQITEKSKEIKRLQDVLAEAEARKSAFDTNFSGLATLLEYAEIFKEKSSTANFDEKRLLCAAFGVKVVVHNAKEVSLTISIPTETKVISLYEDLRCISYDKQSNPGLPERPRNRDNNGSLNSKRRCGKPINDSVFSTYRHAR